MTTRAALLCLRVGRHAHAGIRRAHVSAMPIMRVVSSRAVPGLDSISSAPARLASSRSESSANDLSEADLIYDDVEEQYATAQDEYEIALEETQNGTIYAEKDRAAARQQLERVLKSYVAVVEGEDSEIAERITKGLYPKIKQLADDVEKLDEMASEHD